jgi:riboflavin biosynthesis pyrimidine reductase
MVPASKLIPLHTLLELRRGRQFSLTPKLARLYGGFRMSARSSAHVFSNFVSTLDGVVSLQVKGHEAGSDISGHNAQDRMVMGLLRAVADVVIVGSGTLAADPHHVWTPEAICPELATDYRRLQSSIAKRQAALNVVVSASGQLDLRLPVFASGRVPVVVVTTPRGARHLSRQAPRTGVEIISIRGGARIAPGAILDAVSRVNCGKRILIEGGPQLLGTFYRERLLNEQFLTLAPQIAGRNAGDGRLGLVMGTTFAPRDPLWGELGDVRRGVSHLFLRYSFTGNARNRR